MGELICPLCSTAIEEGDPHIYKHFKYKRFDCGDKLCTLSFYTESERNKHCSDTKHKRSFQKTTNPYLENMIDMLVEDAHELANGEDINTVCKNRFGNRETKAEAIAKIFKKRVIPPPATTTADSETGQGTSGASGASGGASGASAASGATPTASSSAGNKKRGNAEAVTTPATKKTRNGAPPSSAAPAATVMTPSTISSRRTTADQQPTSSSTTTTTSQPTSSAQAVVDSTTSDTTPPVPKQPRKKRNSAATTSNQSGNSPRNAEDIASMQRIAGFGDDDVPDKRDAVKVPCELCKQEVVYYYFRRREHVIETNNHMPKSIAEEEFEDFVKIGMDKCFPEGPNSKLACQVCNDNKDISNRREHIEYNHYSILPVLRCPFEGCGQPFKRQCDLSSHMKEIHKTRMPKYKGKEFNENRARRNRCIEELKRRCFPWSEVERLAKKEAKNPPAPLIPGIDTSLANDIRIREAHKTRRAPRYEEESDSDDSDDDDAANSTPSAAAEGEADESAVDDQPIDTADLDIIEVYCNEAITNRLSQRVQIKQEVVEDDAAPEGVVPEYAPSAPKVPAWHIKREVVEQEEPKEERASSMPPAPVSPSQPPSLLPSPPQFPLRIHPPTHFMSQYEPIVPQPFGSPEQINPSLSPFAYARILSPVRAPERREETPNYNKSRSPSRSSPRERITFDVGNGSRGNENGSRYNSNRQNDSSTPSYHRPYNSSYRPPSSRGSHYPSSSSSHRPSSSSSSYQRPPYQPRRNFSNDASRNRSNAPSRGYNNSSYNSTASSSSNYRRDSERRH